MSPELRSTYRTSTLRPTGEPGEEPRLVTVIGDYSTALFYTLPSLLQRGRGLIESEAEKGENVPGRNGCIVRLEDHWRRRRPGTR